MGTFFEGIPEAAMERARSFLETVELDYGTELMNEGEEDPSCLLVVEGEIQVRRNGVEIRTAGPGDMLGESELFGDPKRAVSARTVQPSTLVLLDRAGYDALRAEGSPVATAVERLALAQVSAKLRAVHARLGELMRERAPEEHVPSPGLTTLFGKPLGVWGRKPAQPVDKVAALQRNTSFAQLDPAIVKALAAMMRTRAFRDGKILCRHGEIPDCFFLLVDGQIDVLLGRDAQRAEPIATLGRGSLFGITSVLEKRARSATCRARGEVTVLTLDARQWEAIDAQPEDAANAVRAAVVAALGRQLADGTDSLARLEIEERQRIRAGFGDDDDPDDHDPTLHDLAFGR